MAQVLVSLAIGVELVPLGQRRLRDIGHSEAVFDLVAEGVGGPVCQSDGRWPGLAICLRSLEISSGMISDSASSCPCR